MFFNPKMLGIESRVTLTLLAAAAFLPASALAAPFSLTVVYGDSLSDNGNVFAATGSPPPPYFQGRVSNGPVAVEQLAVILNTPLTDYAYAGATTGIGNSLDGGTATGKNALPGMRFVFDLTKNSLDAATLENGLFVVWGGPNDFLSPSSSDGNPLDTADRAVGNIISIVEELQMRGAQHILVPGMPDLGLTPSFRSRGPVAAGEASFVTDHFNTSLSSRLPAGVTYFDTARLLRAAVANPAAYGFTNVTEPCLTVTICAEPDKYLFWDDFHPTTAGHAVLAGQFANAVPEPSTLILAITGLAAVAMRKLKRDAA